MRDVTSAHGNSFHVETTQKSEDLVRVNPAGDRQKFLRVIRHCVGTGSKSAPTGFIRPACPADTSCEAQAIERLLHEDAPHSRTSPPALSGGHRFRRSSALLPHVRHQL